MTEIGVGYSFKEERTIDIGTKLVWSAIDVLVRWLGYNTSSDSWEPWKSIRYTSAPHACLRSQNLTTSQNIFHASINRIKCSRAEGGWHCSLYYIYAKEECICEHSDHKWLYRSAKIFLVLISYTWEKFEIWMLLICFFCRNSFILIKKLKSVVFGFSSIFSVLFFPVRPCRKYADYAIMKSGRLQVNCPYAMYQNLFLRKIIFTEKS